MASIKDVYMKLEKRKVSELKNWDKNPRSITEEGFARLKKQIETLGQYKPLLVNQDNIVIGGNMRLRAYNELGIEEVFVNVIETKDENEMMKYSLSDNDRAGFYDTDLLANTIHDYDIDLSQFAIDIDRPVNLEELLGSFNPVDEPDARLDETEEKEKIKPKKKNKGGRPKKKRGQPTVMTKEVLEKLKQAFKLGATDEEACSYADISPATLYNYQREKPEYLEKKNAWKESPNIIARQAVIRDMAKDGTLALKYLERKKKDEFSLRKEITGGDGKSISVLLDRQESDYDDLGRQARQQMVENEPPVLHQGQAGESEAVQSEPDTSNASGGEGQSQEGADTQS